MQDKRDKNAPRPKATHKAAEKAKINDERGDLTAPDQLINASHQSAESAAPGFGHFSLAQEFCERLYGDCYYIGTQLIRDFHMVRRDHYRFWKKMRETLPRVLRRNRKRVGRHLEKFSDDLLFPYRIIGKETGLLFERLKDHREKNEDALLPRDAWWEYRRATERPFNRIANFFAPIIGVAILAGAIGYFNNMTFALKVDYNGETLGYIKDEKEFYEARKSMLDRLINEEYIPPEESIPSLSLAIVKQGALMQSEELTDAIMRASGNELTRANGFYLDGKFLGAVKDGNGFLLYLDNILSHYRTGEEHEVVHFTKNITLEDGVYPVSSLMSLTTLQDYLRSDEKLERNYSAVKGDTLAAIARRYNTSASELYDLNPDLKNYLTDLRAELGTGTGENTGTAGSQAAATLDSAAPVSTENTSLDTTAEAANPAADPGENTTESEQTTAAQKPQENTAVKAMTLEEVPLRGGEELLVSQINVSLGIQVTRRETYTRDIDFGTTYIDDNTMLQDTKKTVSAGIPGTEEIVSDITYVDGQKVGENVISRTTLSEPVDKKVKVGTKSIKDFLGGSTTGFIWPVDGGYFNGSLGAYPGHTGMDIPAPYGTTIRASASGTVITATSYGWNGGYGKNVVINHGNGVITRYAHMSTVLVSVGQYVSQGTAIGRVGATGNATGNHCHFELRINGVIMAPEKYVGTKSPR